MAGTFIYVIGCKDGPIKIGITGSPEGRLATLKTGCPFPIELWYTRLITTRKRARRHEAAIHLEFVETRSQGEWFSISVERAVQAIETAVDTFDHAYAAEERAIYEAGLV